jgi:hypothetical protein
MPGVFRPYTFADVLGSMADQIGAASAGDTSVGTGHFTEADETLGLTDTAAVTAQPVPPWDEGTWGAFSWR